MHVNKTFSQHFLRTSVHSCELASEAMSGNT